MALSPLEVLMYAIIVAGSPPTPAECELKPDKTVVCSNGITAVEDKKFGMVLQYPKKKENVTFTGTGDGRLLFSNGLEGRMTAAGWIKFSNGIQARRDTRKHGDSFLISPGLECAIVAENKAACKAR